MSHKEIIIDFETMDWGLRDGLGPGFPWGGVKILGMSWCDVNSQSDTEYVTDKEQMKCILDAADIIVAHNAQYEAGLIHYLEVDITTKTILCTKLASQFLKSNRFRSSLDALSQEFLGNKKMSSEMLDKAIEIGLVTPMKSYYAENKETQTYKNARKRATNDMWASLDQLQEVDEIVATYANIDVDLTKKLYLMFKNSLEKLKLWDVYKRFCLLIQATTLMRAQGSRVDIKRTYWAKNYLRGELVAAEAKLWALCGVFNYGSDKQVKEWATELGYPPQPDIMGNLGFGKSWIDRNLDDERVALFGECKKYVKAIEFCDSIIKFEKDGRVYPEMTIMGARTGRFSSRNPNIQQIPGRDKIIGPLIRSLYIPEKGQQWYSLDYSGQEDRLRVHFAASLGIESALDLVDQFADDPNFDTHQDTMDRMNKELGEEVLTRSMAKTQNHGISYGMGVAKQARGLGVSESEARKLKDLFFKVNPYVKELFNAASTAAKRRGFLKTLGGRHVHVDEGFEYKALSALVQGSALDQTAEALIQCYESGIIPLSVVHDEINISGTPGTAEIVKDIMENAFKLKVPTVTSIGSGDNWAEAK